MKKLFQLETVLWIALVTPLIFIGTVMAQETAVPTATTSVTVPWGGWVVQAATVVQPVITLVLTGIASYVMSAYLPPWLKAITGQAGQNRVNAVLTKAVQSALAQTAGAVTGKALTIPLASTVLARAAQYAIDQAPQLIKSATHDQVDNLLKMLMARMEELGVAPPEYDIKDSNAIVKGVTTKDGKFDFSGAVTAGLGGGH